jgi:hypothetical protein
MEHEPAFVLEDADMPVEPIVSLCHIHTFKPRNEIGEWDQ